jgi:fumarate reductase flavoprotein subunit
LEKTGTLEADLVVIGGGGAGLPAALAAAEAGARVMVLEKGGACGGNAAMAWGIFAAESPTQIRSFIDAPRDDLFKIAMSWAHWKINPRLMRAFIDKSGDTIRWFEEMGLRFTCVPMAPNQMPCTWHVPEGRGAEIVKVLQSACAKRKVEILRRVRTKEILTGNKGEVVGVIAARGDEELRIRTSNVIIATGGYGGNKELLRQYCSHYPENMSCEGIPHSGDGLALALRMGGATEGLGILQTSGPSVTGSIALNIHSPAGKLRIMLMAVALEPQTLWVNRRGLRFTDEAVGLNHYEAANPVLLQPGNVSYTLFDDVVANAMEEEGLLLAMGLPTGAVGNKLPGFRDELQKLARKDRVKIAGSMDEIADWIGADRDTLGATVRKYNDSCQGRNDSLFAKELRYLRPLQKPPFYAVRAHANFLTTTGGIKINERMEVLGCGDEPIPGLYAAGVDVGGWNSDTYCAALPGTAFGFAVNSGRIAGENAARRALIR